MLDMDVLVAIHIAVLLLFVLLQQRPTYRHRARHSKPTLLVPEASGQRGRRKPEWVIHEVLRMKAYCPALGCGKLAEAFNRRFADERGMTVCKSTVGNYLSKYSAELAELRRTIKHRIPRPMPCNRVWGLDLTGKADLKGKQRVILGLLDHGARACLRLQALSDKRSATILRELIAAFRRFGLPKAIRVDNEACFNSVLVKAALALLGIRLQTIALHCPWQNGRVERFFGTLKERLDRIAIADPDDLRIKLIEFRAWYNHVRSHQHLGGRTPSEAWERRDKSRKRPRFFSVWGGLLNGWYFPP